MASLQHMTNPSCVLYGPGKLEIEDRVIPPLETEHDVIIRIAFVGVCGSDVHFWRHGGVNKKVDPTLGLVMGHEASGIVHAIGSKVSRVAVGDRVAIEPGIPCRRCSNCKKGVYNLCSDIKFAAAPPDSPGTLAKYFRSAEDFVYKMDDRIRLEEAVLVEPLAVAVHAVRLVDVRPGEVVTVFGSGTVGLLCAAVAKVHGASRVILVDILERKLDFAKGYLDCETFKPDMDASAEENARRLLDGFDMAGVDAVIEASGAASSVQTGIHILHPGGKYVQTGLGKPEITFPIVTVSEKELLFRGCFRYGPGDYELATSLVSRKLVDLASLISSVSPFEETVSAWEKTARGEGIKNLIRGLQD